MRALLKDNDIYVQIEAAKYLEKEGMMHLSSLLSTENDIDEDEVITIIQLFQEYSFMDSIDSLKNYFKKTENQSIRFVILD